MFPCPYSNEHDCDEAFQRHVEASHHAILSHQVVHIHKTEDGQFICLHAEFGCSTTFVTTTLLTTHTQSEHRKEAFPCALAWSRNCTKTFTTRKGMAMHINAKNRQIREPCPSAKETGCKATFSDVSSAHSHVRHVHGEKPYPCPWADEYDCTEWFYTVALAQRHAGICHKKLGFPCPRAEQLDCMARFNSKLKTQKHLHEEHQPNPFPCPGAEKHQCEKRFPTYNAARKHMGRDHERFPCPRADELGCSQTFSLKLTRSNMLNSCMTISSSHVHMQIQRLVTRCLPQWVARIGMQNIIQTISLVNISIAENDFSLPRKLSNIPAIRSIRSQLSSSARFRGAEALLPANDTLYQR